jgi:hypothetical protein
MSGIHSGDLSRAVAEWDGNGVTGAYLWWWSGGEHGARPDDRWDGLLDGRTVELRGPADFVPADCDLLARVLRGVEADPTCDIAYSNYEFWPKVDKSERLALVSKGSEASVFPYGRTMWDSERLFAPGAFNMGPAAMLDLLTGGAQVTVTGVTFYATGRDYLEDASRTSWESIQQHNPIINRRIIKNLFDVGLVGATGVAADVLSWSDAEYVSALEKHRL